MKHSQAWPVAVLGERTTISGELSTAPKATQESKSLLKRIGPLDDRLREMTRFGERQLSLERSQFFKVFTF